MKDLIGMILNIIWLSTFVLLPILGVKNIKSKGNKKKLLNLLVVNIVAFFLTGTVNPEFSSDIKNILTGNITQESFGYENGFDINKVPEFSNKPYVVVNGNNPFWDSKDLSSKSFEEYSELDNLGRCGIATASIGVDLMPTEKRKPINMIKPSGWQTIKYDVVDGKYLYNRAHLIGFQLTSENANKNNLITGTRYMNVEGMLPFENMVADYIKETKNHVMYRVTPIFIDNNLVASGVLMEAESVEDNGAGVKFNVYCYNNQPGVEIDYKTGNSKLE